MSLPKGSLLDMKLNSVILNHSEVGEKVKIKQSAVGSAAKLSSKYNLNNVILMNNATLKDIVILQNLLVISN